MAVSPTEPLVVDTRRRSARIVKRETKDEEVRPVKQEEELESPVAVGKRKTRKRESATPAAAATSTSTTSSSSRRSKRVKVEEVEEAVADPADQVSLPRPRVKRPSSPPSKTPKPKAKPKPEPAPNNAALVRAPKPAKSKEDKAKAEEQLRAKKLRSYTQFAKTSPFPDFAQPTAQACQRAHRILAALHGDRKRPAAGTLKAPKDAAGCGDSPSVLDALVRTILSQNTSSANSTRAKRGMDAVYGGIDRWEAVAAGGQAKLQAAIASGGLAGVKSRAILAILEAVRARYGAYTLDHLFAVAAASDVDADVDGTIMRELLAFPGVGPKTASCVLLFCLGRPSFAVDTHVYRLTGPAVLGWRPPDARCDRDAAFAHLDARVPDGLKYALHVLLIAHGRACGECRAGGRAGGGCELRRAFGGRGSGEGEVGGGGDEEEVEFEEGAEEVKREGGEEDVKKTGRAAIAHAVEQSA
ncbi:hypothetical protein SLS62_008989 [Diatrype stigma]|uniref:HhH-GPD domain-containing protein n=1 Tax=Diatrype stigma TaxID=117547 RepID=A0AAN9YJR6_9PEZI